MCVVWKLAGADGVTDWAVGFDGPSANIASLAPGAGAVAAAGYFSGGARSFGGTTLTPAGGRTGTSGGSGR